LGDDWSNKGILSQLPPYYVTNQSPELLMSHANHQQIARPARHQPCASHPLNSLRLLGNILPVLNSHKAMTASRSLFSCPKRKGIRSRSCPGVLTTRLACSLSACSCITDGVLGEVLVRGMGGPANTTNTLGVFSKTRYSLAMSANVLRRKYDETVCP